MIGNTVRDHLRHNDVSASAIDTYALDRSSGAPRSPLDRLDLSRPTTPVRPLTRPGYPRSR